MTLGSHGDAMVALPRHATVDGKPLPELVDQPTLERLFQRTRDGGAEIVGAAEEGERVLRAERVDRADGRGDRGRHARGAAGLRVGDGAVRDRRRLRRRARRSSAAEGVEEIVELDLNDEELAALRAAAEGIRAKCADLAQL